MGTMTIPVREPSVTEAGSHTNTDDFVSSYRSSLGQLVGYFRSKGVPADEAADLANESIVRMLVHLKRHGRERTDLGPLVRTIARNLLVERIRKHSPVMVPLDDEIDVADDHLEPADEVLATERREAVREAIRGLAPRHRHVVGMWMEGRTPTEIARHLGIKRNAVDAILHRARRSLASKLDGGGVLGLFGIAALRIRFLVRRATEFIGSADPSGNVSAAGTTIAAASLAAALTFVSPAQSAIARPSADAARLDRSTLAGNVAKTARSDVHAATDAARSVSSRVTSIQRTYEMNLGTQLGSRRSDKESATVAEVTYDPNKNGYSPVDALLESVIFKRCATSGTCLEKRR